jgi:hypothetical protein
MACRRVSFEGRGMFTKLARLSTATPMVPECLRTTRQVPRSPPNRIASRNLFDERAKRRPNEDHLTLARGSLSSLTSVPPKAFNLVFDILGIYRGTLAA